MGVFAFRPRGGTSATPEGGGAVEQTEDPGEAATEGEEPEGEEPEGEDPAREAAEHVGVP